ncbi:hypothetical protein NE237_032648 [Protea cynaroides]|uniref:Uncharacterized protein n=1 Tax=Protea cynaroides TaxID=273540 RepID=A0A9Q0L4C8_9MAGN|nr:hypothetical protein NE237_032648 [Protea cynaroides]
MAHKRLVISWSTRPTSCREPQDPLVLPEENPRTSPVHPFSTIPLDGIKDSVWKEMLGLDTFMELAMSRVAIATSVVARLVKETKSLTPPSSGSNPTLSFEMPEEPPASIAPQVPVPTEPPTKKGKCKEAALIGIDDDEGDDDNVPIRQRKRHKLSVSSEIQETMGKAPPKVPSKGAPKKVLASPLKVLEKPSNPPTS